MEKADRVTEHTLELSVGPCSENSDCKKSAVW
jgi:hypothetical protein